jgi:hypothetical protein
VATAQSALAAAPQELKDAISQRLELYKAGTVFTEPSSAFPSKNHE